MVPPMPYSLPLVRPGNQSNDLSLRFSCPTSGPTIPFSHITPRSITCPRCGSAGGPPRPRATILRVFIPVPGHHGEGGRGSRGGGGRGSRGEPPPPPPEHTQSTGKKENLLENEQLSTWKCHVVGRKQRKFIIECQFRVPTSHQYTTTTTKRDIHHLMPNDIDLSCQSKLDSPKLEPPSVVELELEPDDDDEYESLPEWETSDKLSGGASPSTDSGSKSTSAFCLL